MAKLEEIYNCDLCDEEMSKEEYEEQDGVCMQCILSDNVSIVGL